MHHYSRPLPAFRCAYNVNVCCAPAVAPRWLYKASRRGRWERRLFILAPGLRPDAPARLTYYADEALKRARGFVRMSDVTALACVGEGRKVLLFTPRRLWRLQPSDARQAGDLLQALRPMVPAEVSLLAQGWAHKLPRSKLGRAVSVGNPWRRCVSGGAVRLDTGGYWDGGCWDW